MTSNKTSSSSDNNSKFRTDKQAIGLFDSGVGGLTVLKEVARQLPYEKLIYFGDLAHLPYGNKSSQAIIRYSIENTMFFMEKKVKMLIVACNTASVYSLEILQKVAPFPVIGVIDCSIQQLIQSTRSQEIAVLGTAGTIASQVHQRRLLAIAPNIKVHSIACPLFVPLVEEGMFEHPATELIVEHYLAPLQKTATDAVLLACTHYPLLQNTIQKIVGPNIALIEPAQACASQAKALLHEKKLLNPDTTSSPPEFYSSDIPEQFQKLASLIFGSQIEKVHLKH
ncbi:MAG: glutamate racemase [Chlamydiia bacterium]|nr:glutamate racemase [Chlamydiia bacterium]